MDRFLRAGLGPVFIGILFLSGLVGCGGQQASDLNVSTPIAKPPLPTPSPLPAPASLVVGNTDGSGVFIRRTATASDWIKAWPDSTVMVVIGSDKESEGTVWKNVKDPEGNEGWIPAKYLLEPTATPPR